MNLSFQRTLAGHVNLTEFGDHITSFIKSEFDVDVVHSDTKYFTKLHGRSENLIEEVSNVQLYFEF